LAEKLSELLGHLVAVGSLDVSLHRDDLTGRGIRELLPTNLPFDVSGRTVLLVDDVLFTGRTVRAAMDTLNDYGRPSRIQLAVLIDRGHRELPITADFVGNQMTTTLKQKVRVEWGGDGGEERVVLEE
jgi:pyrimidine operon attenuation protein/uracil phosphoribosyltransferase